MGFTIRLGASGRIPHRDLSRRRFAKILVHDVAVPGEVEHKLADERKRQLELMRSLSPEQLRAIRDLQRQISQIVQSQQKTIETTATQSTEAG